MKLARVMLFVLFTLAANAFAHEVRPAYLELRQTGPETYDVLWKVPGQGENLRLGIYAELPTGCTNVTQPRGSMTNGAFSEVWTVQCSGGIEGGTIHIAGLRGTMIDVLARIQYLDGRTQVARLTPASPSFLVEAAPGLWRVAGAYLGLGVEHILLGIDHLLFVLALMIITRGGWMLVKTVTAFTVSHSLTLTAAALGFVHVPQAPVEAVIALSIVFVACEIVHRAQGRSGLTERWPWIVALTFGLLHGLGFAGALSEVGLPQGHIPLALLFFSVGVEAGQFLFIAAVLLTIVLAQRARLSTPKWAQFVPPYAIGSVAMFWVIQRVAGF